MKGSQQLTLQFAIGIWGQKVSKKVYFRKKSNDMSDHKETTFVMQKKLLKDANGF